MTQVESDFRVNGLENGPSTMDHSGLEEDPVIQEIPHENGHVELEMDIEDGLEGGQISPSSRRRSTRGAALKAQEKIKLKEGYEAPIGQEDSPQFNGQVGVPEEFEDKIEESSAKRPKLELETLDQFSHKFGIQLKDGEVVMMQDDSMISSLNEHEVENLKKNYEKILARELSEEQKKERLHMIKHAEAALRLEEARLMMLKKIRNSQTNPVKVTLEAQKKAAASVPNNSSGTAYKPPIATPPNKPSTSTASATANAAALQNAKNKAAAVSLLKANPILALSGLTPAQQQELLRSAQINPLQAAQQLLSKATGNSALMQAFAAQQQLQKQAAAAAAASSSSLAGAASTTASASASSNSLAAQTPQQRAAAARQAFRRQADQQLSQLATPPKPPPHDTNFIPNANQPDFLYLLGLDIVVQKVLRDKSVNQSVEEPPYECEECGTDFTPSWRAIGTSDKELHLYCELCVKNAQKKKIRTDHTNSLKKLFANFAAQEKNFEKQIADGTLEAVLTEHTKSVQASSSSQPQNLSTKLPNASSTTSLPTVSGTSTPQPQKTSTPVPSSSTPSSSKTPSHATPSSAKKTQQQVNANAMQNAAMQAQFAALTQMARQNPVMAAMMGPMMQQMMTNPTAMQQMMQMGWNPMMLAAAQAQQQARLAAAAQAQQQPNQMAMNLLAQAMQNANGGANGQSGVSSSNAALMAQLAAATGMSNMSNMNPAAALLANPQLLQQMRQQMMKTKK